MLFTWKTHCGLKFCFGQIDRSGICTEVSFTSSEVMWTLVMKLPYTEVKFHPEVKSQTDLSSLRVSCKRALNCRCACCWCSVHQEKFLLLTTIILWNFSPVLKIYNQFFFLIPKICYWVLSSACTWLHLYFPFGKFHLDIHNNKIADNGTALPHETAFDISKDRFCSTDIFIRWFEDFQLSYEFVRLLLKVEICSAWRCCYLQTWLSVL